MLGEGHSPLDLEQSLRESMGRIASRSSWSGGLARSIDLAKVQIKVIGHGGQWHVGVEHWSYSQVAA